MFDVIIVGSGPAGTFAAYGLHGLKVLVLDVGKTPPPLPDYRGNLYDLKKSHKNLSELFIGSNFEGLHNINQIYLNPKLKAPLNRYIIDQARELTPIAGGQFEPLFSLAKGGMANGWGAGTFRFLDRELKDYPISYSDLKPYYDELTGKIGINGLADDLSEAFGGVEGLLEAQPLPYIGQRILEKYNRHKNVFRDHNLKIGRQRQAVLTQDHDGRSKAPFDNLDFFKPYQPSIYNPAFTLDELINKNSIRYEAGYFVESFSEKDQGVEVQARNLKTNTYETFKAKKLILAAGVLNTAKIVLNSFKDFNARLPLSENAISYIPFIDVGSIGKAVEKATPLASLGLLRDAGSSEDVRWCSIYGLSGPLKSEYLFDFPLSASANLAASKYLSPAMFIVQAFYPGDRQSRNSLRLLPSGAVDISFQQRPLGDFEKEVIRVFRRLGLFSHISLCKFPEPGNSFHYACTLPMKEKPTHYETSPDGLLFNTRSVYIADSSNFTSLPAINLTFTIMANSLRIARKLKAQF